MKAVFLIMMILCASVIHAQTMIDVTKWGADPTGKEDALPAIQKAIDAASPNQKTIFFFPRGIYQIGSFTKTSYSLENYSIKMHDNLEFRGEGNVSVIRLADHIFEGNNPDNNAHLFFGKNLKHITFSQLCIDLNGTSNTPAENVKKNHSAIFITHGQDVTIQQLKIMNAAGTNMINIKGNGSGLAITGSTFLNELKVQQANCYQYDFSFLYSEWDHTSINNCVIELQKDTTGSCTKVRPYNGGIEIHGSDSYVTNCSISNCFPGIYIASTGKRMKQVVVSDNKLMHCTKGISFWLEYPMDSIFIKNNYISIQSEKLEHFRFCAGIEAPNGNAKTYNKTLANAASIEHLIISKNKIESAPSAENASGIILHSLKHAVIKNNHINGINRGIVLLGSQWGTSDCLLQKNIIEVATDRYIIDKQQSCPILLSDLYPVADSGKCSFDNIDINNNLLTFKNKVTLPVKPCIALVEMPEHCRQHIPSICHFRNNFIQHKKASVCWNFLQ